MKRITKTIFFLCIAVCLSGCSKSAKNEEEMLQIITKENNISKESSIQVIGTIELENASLICTMTGDSNQGHSYYATEFEKNGKKYEYIHDYKLYDRGMDMYSLPWSSGYVFLSNNEKSNSLRIIKDGKEEIITIDKIPFVYYYDTSGISNFEYFFLDEDEEAISL